MIGPYHETDRHGDPSLAGDARMRRVFSDLDTILHELRFSARDRQEQAPDKNSLTMTLIPSLEFRTVCPSRLIHPGVRMKLCLTVIFGLICLATQSADLKSEPLALSDRQKQSLSTHVVPRYPVGWRFKFSDMKASVDAMPIAIGSIDKDFKWTTGGKHYALDDYMARQPVTALLIAKNGTLIFERYQYGAKASSLFLSNSIAKSLTGIAFGFLQQEGRLHGFDVPTADIIPALAGTPMGETTLRNHLRMGSGVKFLETYEPGDDRERFGTLTLDMGQLEAIKTLTARERPQGEQFHYTSPSSATLSLAVQALTGQNLAHYLGPRLWERIGSEHPAFWAEDLSGASRGQCCIFARPRDYLRLGIVLANDGLQPASGQQIIPREFLINATTATKLDPGFAPRPGSWGYENQFWVMSGPRRQFALLGVYGQHIMIDPVLKLVVVQFAVTEKARADQSTMLRERTALWSALVSHFQQKP